MIDTWEEQILKLENKAQHILGDEIIDKVFVEISDIIQERLWEGYSLFIEGNKLENEIELENEIMDCVKRDESIINSEGFFTELLEVYKQGYWPCSWEGTYPNGNPVVI